MELDREAREFEEAWQTVRKAPREIAQGKRDRLLKQRAEIDREIAMLDQILADVDVQPAIIKPNPSLAKVSTSLQLSTGELPNKPTGLLMVMAENPTRTWKLSDARDEMVNRGWLQPGDAGTHQIQNTAWKLKNRGHLESPRNGYYRITQEGLNVLGDKLASTNGSRGEPLTEATSSGPGGYGREGALAPRGSG